MSFQNSDSVNSEDFDVERCIFEMSMFYICKPCGQYGWLGKDSMKICKACGCTFRTHVDASNLCPECSTNLKICTICENSEKFRRDNNVE